MTCPRDPIAWEATLPGVRPSSPAWRATVRAVYGTPLAAAELELLRSLTGGVEPPAGGASEALAVVGRRGGKSEACARLAVFESLHGGHHVTLAPGQVATIAVVAPLREQAAELLRYVRGLAAIPSVARRVVSTTADAIELTTRVTIKVMTADAVAVSSYTIATAILDEAAKLPGDEAAEPDHEIIASLRPALAPVRGAPPRRLIAITSAYLDEGWAFATERDHFGRPGAPVFVVRGSTERFNPNIDRGWLERERRRAPRVFAREYLCEWQSAVTESWFGDAAIDRCVDLGRASSPPEAGHRYVVAIDAAFRGDRFALAVAHAERRGAEPPVAVLDRVLAWQAPRGGSLSVEDTVQRVAGIAREYGTGDVLADQYGVEPLRLVFARHGVRLLERTWTAQSKPAWFRRVRDGMADGLVRLCNDADLLCELRNVQGRLLRSGCEQIEARRGHDDRVSAAVLALFEATQRAGRASEAATLAVLRAPVAVATRWPDEGEDYEAEFGWSPYRASQPNSERW